MFARTLTLIARPDHSTCEAKAVEPKVVTVVVVSAKDKMEVFLVREDLLYSRALNVKNWPNTTTIIKPGRQIRTTGRGPTTFKLYLRWISSPQGDLASYARMLLQQTMIEGARDTRMPRLLITILVSLWALADELGDSACKNSAMDTLIVEHATGRLSVPPTLIHPLLERGGLTSHVSRWLLDHCVARITVKILDTHRGSLPAYFEGLVLRRILEKNEAGEALTIPALGDACRYHDHGEGEPKCT